MNAKSGNTVTVHYTGTLDDGTEFDSSRGKDPLTFTLGSGQLIPGFDSAVVGMSVGDVKDVRVAPTEAYGEVKEDFTQVVAQNGFPPNFDFIVGGQVVGQSPQGMPVVATIVSLDEQASTVTVDLNHPMAGKTLNFDIELINIS